MKEFKKAGKLSSSAPCPEHRVFVYISRESGTAAIRSWVDKAPAEDFTVAIRLIEEVMYAHGDPAVNVGTALLLALDGVEKYYKGAQPLSYLTLAFTIFGGVSSVLVLITTYGFYLRAHQRRRRVPVHGGGNQFDVFDRFARNMAFQAKSFYRYF